MYCLLYQCAVISVHQYKKDERKLMAIKPITEVSSGELSFFING